MKARRCPLCASRKGRRACPALGEPICPSCCGSKRKVEVSCPEDCVYLSGPHSPGWDHKAIAQRRDARRIVPFVAQLSEGQRELLSLALTGIAAMRLRRRDLDDRLLGEAVQALGRTVETRTRGVLYDFQADDLQAQGVVYDLRMMFETTNSEGHTVSPSDTDLLAVLTALDAAIEATRRELLGSSAFLDAVVRIVGPAVRQEPESPLIVPGR
jgi:hypothetical protein